MNTTGLRGLSTVSYWTADMAAAKKWYTELLGVPPYYEVGEAYAEFRIGDYQHELGLIDSQYSPTGPASGPGGAVIYWHVDDVDTMLEKLLAMGATAHEPPTDRGQGFITATVIDPFGNILGFMYNPHYLEILKATPSNDSSETAGR